MDPAERLVRREDAFHTCRDGEMPDGFRCDRNGNPWCGWAMGPELDGVRVLNPDGKAIGHIDLPERCANLRFGGERRNRRFMGRARACTPSTSGRRAPAWGDATGAIPPTDRQPAKVC